MNFVKLMLTNKPNKFYLTNSNIYSEMVVIESIDSFQYSNRFNINVFLRRSQKTNIRKSKSVVKIKYKIFAFVFLEISILDRTFKSRH